MEGGGAGGGDGNAAGGNGGGAPPVRPSNTQTPSNLCPTSFRPSPQRCRCVCCCLTAVGSAAAATCLQDPSAAALQMMMSMMGQSLEGDGSALPGLLEQMGDDLSAIEQRATPRDGAPPTPS